MPQPQLPHLGDPSELPSFDAQNLLQVVVETPRGSRNKYTFDHERRIFVLRKILPAGIAFPHDFGFVPSTLAPDDDPIDVLLLTDEPAFPGCVVDARLIGVILGENRRPDGTTYRNDRLLAVSAVSHAYAYLHHVAQLPVGEIDSLKQFFETYPRLLGDKVYQVLGVGGPDVAADLLEQARRTVPGRQPEA